MQIAEVVALPPACCAICKKGNTEEPEAFVDTLSHYPQGQRMDRIYVCHECVEEMAGLYGFVTKTQAQKFKDQIETLEAEKAEVEFQNKALVSIQNALDVFRTQVVTETPVEKPKSKPKAAKPKPEPAVAEPVEE